MNIETGLNLRQTQRLAITPMLQAAIKLLQLSRLELSQVLQQYITENPMLEEESTLGAEDNLGPEMESDQSEIENPLDEKADKSDLDWENYLEGASDSYISAARGEGKEPISLESCLSKPRSIAEHLLFQLHVSTEDEKIHEIGQYLVGNLDENGYLQVSLEEVAQALQVSLEEAQETLHLIQAFDPPGIAARDLRECLLLQLQELQQENSLAAQIVTHFLKEWEEKRLPEIAEKLHVSMDALRETIQQIEGLDPKPGLTFCDEDPQYIIPDVYIIKVDDKYIISLNEDGLPRLRISPYYRRVLAERRWDNIETREYIRDKVKQAIWLIRSIEQRQRTLSKVAESLVKFQRRFLEEGINYLRPLTLKDVAEDISMHESTVSRVTTNKYIYTPQGIFELKYFFHRGLSSDHGGVISSVNVRERLRRIVQEEGNGKPISDQRLAEILQNQGVNISRRTIAKYRAQLRIPSSNRRKKI